jgi:hypothetical protein
MQINQIWPVLLPFLTQHYPWIVPVIAVLFPIAAVFRGLSLLLGSYRSVQQTEHARDEDRYRATIEQRDAALRDPASERARPSDDPTLDDPVRRLGGVPDPCGADRTKMILRPILPPAARSSAAAGLNERRYFQRKHAGDRGGYSLASRMRLRSRLRSRPDDLLCRRHAGVADPSAL